MNGLPWTSPTRRYASASSRRSARSPSDSRARPSRYSSARVTTSALAAVAPGRSRIASWNSKRKELASRRTSLNRRSARASARRARLRLEKRRRDAAEERDDHDGGGGEPHAVPPRELAGPVGKRSPPRLHGLSLEIAAHVLGELIGGGVPQVGLLAHRAEHDGVEVGAEPRRAGARTLRVGLADDPHQLLRVARLDPVGFLVREQLVEHDAQRVDVARRRDRAAADLLRARVLGRERPQQRRRLLPHRRAGIGPQQLRDSEVEQLRRALRRHEDVAGLQVAVDHEVLVGVLHRGADLPEEDEPVPDRELVAAAEVEQRDALDVLHDEVGLAFLGGAAVEQPRDPGVVERGRDLALVAKALQRLRAGHSGADELDGDLLLELVVGAAGEIHLAHAAAAQLFEKLVGADALADAPSRRTLLPWRRAGPSRPWARRRTPSPPRSRRAATRPRSRRAASPAHAVATYCARSAAGLSSAASRTALARCQSSGVTAAARRSRDAARPAPCATRA